MTARITTRSVDELELTTLNLAIQAIQLVFHARLAALMFVDSRGMFLHTREGNEREVLELLRRTNWDDAVRHAVEAEL